MKTAADVAAMYEERGHSPELSKAASTLYRAQVAAHQALPPTLKGVSANALRALLFYWKARAQRLEATARVNFAITTDRNPDPQIMADEAFFEEEEQEALFILQALGVDPSS
jgi:hypothetical protein